MKASAADQRRLLDVADLDSTIAQLTHRRQTLPELAALAALGRQRMAVSEKLTQAETAISDARAAQERIESDLDPARARLVRNQQRVDSGEVPDAKALKNLVDEVEHLKGRIDDLEDQDLEAMQVVEDAVQQRDLLTAERAEIDDQARGVIKSRDEKLAALDAELSAATADRDATASHIAADLVALYDRLAERLGTGAAMLQRGRCTGCQIEADAAAMQRYAAAAEDEVLRCDECDRIVVRTSQSGLPA
jgi:uncharacterized protein